MTILKSVKSSNVAEVGYDSASRVLHVRYKDGSLYKYEDVPPEKHQALMASISKGKYLNAHIRYQHTYERIA